MATHSMKSVMTVAMIVLATSLTLLVAPPTAAEPGDLAARVAFRPAELRRGGDVLVHWRWTCPVGVDAFRLEVAVTQGEAEGLWTSRRVARCEGRTIVDKTAVFPTQGRFEAGRSVTVTARIVRTESPTGEASDTKVVSLREARQGPVAWIAREKSRPIAADGAVRVPIWVRCSQVEQVGTIQVAILQGDVAQSVTLRRYPPSLVCDDVRHRTFIRVPAGSGRLLAGPAEVTFHAEILDEPAGSQTDISDRASIELTDPA